MEARKVDLLIVGAGSGGIGTALAAGREGLDVLLIEKQDTLGGNAAIGGVNVWEMGVGGTGIPFEIYKRLKGMRHGVGIYRFNVHRKWQLERGEHPLHPGAELVIDPTLRYTDTLLRHGSGTGIANEAYVREHWHGVPFDPSAYQAVIGALLAEQPTVTVRTGTTFSRVNLAGQGTIRSVELADGAIVEAGHYIDATDNAYLCEAAGATLLQGQEGRAAYGEPAAPELATRKLNGVSLIYRIGKPDGPISEAPLTDPEGQPGACWWADDFPVASIVQYPDGDFNVNMLPTMDGEQFQAYGSYADAYAECRKRVHAHFRHIQSAYPPYRNLVIKWLAPRLGVRESRRVLAEYQLTQHDLLLGLTRQSHPDIITIADHPMDTHGKETGRAGCRELDEPYGVPFRCLIPKGFSNLLVASRAAGFSSLAASSCRLSRTMMQLGQAAGIAASIAARSGCAFTSIDAESLRAKLSQVHVQLAYPPDQELKEYLADE